MEIPAALANALAVLLSGEGATVIANARTISERYRNRSRSQGGRFVAKRSEALAYAASRMPATYGAVYQALRQALQSMPPCAEGVSKTVTMLDIGAGTGAAAWAADALLPLSAVTCVEFEASLRTVGQMLMTYGSSVLQNAAWLDMDIDKDDLKQHADWVVAAYMLNELSTVSQVAVAKKLWALTDNVLLLVEPGTPNGWAILKNLRSMLIASGAFIIAPCPHIKPCPIQEPDWCHFACRVPRSRMHRMAKSGEAPYEDEKFAYMAFSRFPPNDTDDLNGRVIRHPRTDKGRVSTTLCTGAGIITKTVTRRDGMLYKQARKTAWGDLDTPQSF